MARYETVREAARAWVDGFTHIPFGIVQKLLAANCEELNEVTPPKVNDRVYIYEGEYDGCEGEIIGLPDDAKTRYTVRLDDGEEADFYAGDFEVEHDDTLPMWGTMWAFGNQLDNDWLSNDDGLRMMADCGFRIYEQEDYGYIFGIDGAGYDFYDEHWVPLYKVRGLQWHENKEVAA